MKKITPYSDAKMLYNEKLNNYELTPSYIKATYGNTFTDDAVLERRIRKNTKKVLGYINAHTNSGNIRLVNSLILKTEEYRKWFFDALDNQMEADLASGYNDNDLYVARNGEERAMQSVNEVSVATQQVLESSRAYGGINLLSMSLLSAWCFLTFGDF